MCYDLILNVERPGVVQERMGQIQTTSTIWTGRLRCPMKAVEGCVKPFKAIARLVGQSVENTPSTIDDGCILFPLKILVSYALPIIFIPPASHQPKYGFLNAGLSLFGSPSTSLLAEESQFLFGSPCEAA